MEWANRFFEVSTQLLAVLDAEGRLLEVNPAWRRLLGWRPEQLRGEGCWDYVHPEERALVRARLRALGATDSHLGFTCRWRCTAGTWKVLSWSVVSCAAEKRLYCTLTPQQGPELAPLPFQAPFLGESPALGELSDALPFGLYLLQTSTGRVLYANHRFRQMAGLLPFEDVLARGGLTHARVLECVRGGLHESAFEGIRVFASGEAFSRSPEAREVELASGQVLRRLATPLYDTRGASPCQLYVFEDVTDTRRTRETLQRAEFSSRKLIESLPEGLFVHRDQRFVYLNPAMCAALGYEHADALLGQSLWNIVHPDSVPQVLERQRTVAAGGVARVQELRYVRRDGTSFDAESTSLTIEFDGRPAVAVTARDVTERKRMQAQLLQTDRMAMVGTLAAGVGHEINNPLSYILTNLRLALENTQQLQSPLSEQERAHNLRETQEMLEEAHAGGLRVRDIVRDLKLFSRPAEEKKSEVDVLEPLEFSLKMALGELRHRARLVKRYEPVPRVIADESRLGQVFLNLLMNAAQAIAEGAVERNEIAVWVRPAETGGVAVDVSDTGTGIAPEVLDRIFDPFFTTKPVGMGTGLGLSICQGILRDLGGELTVRSELGVGTTFTVLLPLAPSLPPNVPERPAHRALPAVRPGRMLVIDDEPAVARSLARLIGPRHQVTIVSTGREGLAQLGGEASFDIIFCDLMMPDATGMDIYERVSELRPDVARRFIFLTGGSFTPRARRFLESMPERWLEKPFDEQRLRRLIGEVLRAA
jgi:PAS domain S-box-containing protein